ncbi:hypothetical protein C0J52_21907 [Blattella germanica]|nr:hypothetical protein C0J52_21907 [Blattella germanica]
MALHKCIATVFIMFYVIKVIYGINKYSKDANLKAEETSDLRNLQKPFRMAKLNILWSKAQLRLTESKLKSLFSELKIHDKEELTWKRLSAEGMDKDGLKEADLRKKLIGIMSIYGLIEHFDDVDEPNKLKQHKPQRDTRENHLNKSIFKDKKLNKLWDKAETSGFTGLYN